MNFTFRNQTKDFSEAVIAALERCVPTLRNKVNNEAICGRTLDDIIRCELYAPTEGELNELVNKKLKRIALHIYGKNFNISLAQLRNLVFVGDGPCPNCGSNDVEEDDHWFRCLNPECQHESYTGRKYLKTAI